MKNKGKVHPSPPPLLPTPSSSSSSEGDDCLSVLRLLPAVILVLVSALSLEDRKVLAYLITRSLKTTTTATAGAKSDSKRPSNKKFKTTHRPPVFDCECFDCYTSYWFKWDSSPDRELIHQIIDAFEDHITNGEKKNSASQKPNGRGKKKDKSGRRRVVEPSGRPEEPIATKVTQPMVVVSDEVTPEKSPERLAVETEKPTEVLRFPVAAATGHKGLARKVLPDVVGLFNSRFWRLWNPNAPYFLNPLLFFVTSLQSFATFLSAFGLGVVWYHTLHSLI